MGNGILLGVLVAGWLGGVPVTALAEDPLIGVGPDGANLIRAVQVRGSEREIRIDLLLARPLPPPDAPARVGGEARLWLPGAALEGGSQRIPLEASGASGDGGGTAPGRPPREILLEQGAEGVWLTVPVAEGETPAFRTEGTRLIAQISRPLPPQALSPLPELGSSIVTLVSSLALVLGCLGICLFVLQRIRKGRGGGKEASIRVTAHCALGPKKAITLVEVAGRILVVGTTPTEMRLLAQIGKGQGAGGRDQGSGPRGRESEVGRDGGFEGALARAVETYARAGR